MNEYLHDYQYEAAGRVWCVPSVKLMVFPDGTKGISLAEFNRIHRAIVNEICGAEELLSIEELDFLCDVTVTTYTEIALELNLHRSALTRWRKSGSIPHRLYSSSLKRFFWFKAFGGDLVLSDTSLSLSALKNDGTVLKFMHDQAIAQHFAEPMPRVAA